MYKLIFLLLVSHSLAAQFVQSASGESTIKLDGSALNVDITDARISYWYQQSISDKGRLANKIRLVKEKIEGLEKITTPSSTQQLELTLQEEELERLEARFNTKKDGVGNLIGARVFAANGQGLTNLLSSGDVVTKSGLEFTYGRYFVFEGSGGEIYRKRLDKLGLKRIAIGKKLRDLEVRGTRDPNYFTELDQLDQARKQIEREIDLLRLRIIKVNERSVRLLPYVNFETNVSSVKSTLSPDSVVDVSKLTKSIPISYTARIGIQSTIGKAIIGGISVGISKSDNLADLSEKEFKQTNTKNIPGGQTSYSATEKAYVGDYRQFHSKVLNADLLWRLRPLADGDSLVFFVNPYLRYRNPFATRVYPLPDAAVATTDVGISFYVFKSKGVFVGGLYTELQDLRNNRYKRAQELATKAPSPVETPSVVKLTDRLQVGLFVKISFMRLGTFGNSFSQ